MRLPKEALEAAGFAVGQEITLDVSAERIVLRAAKPRRKRIRIEALLSKMPKGVKSLPESWTASPRGKEVW